MIEKQSVIYLAGGCFWGVEAFISRLKGVNNTEVGYANGKDLAPTYEKVCTGKTGHTETVKVTYNPKIITLNEILENFFSIIDPFAKNRQGPDIGTQYRTGIYWQEEFQRDIVRDFLRKKQKSTPKRIAVEAHQIHNFYPAEDYHQKYLERNPQGYCHVDLNLIDDEEFDHLTREEYEITQLSMTEPPFSGKYDNFFEDGIYVDVVDGEFLFSSDDKFDSGCGWPAFSKPISQDAIKRHRDFSHGTTRIEVRSAKSNSHLGHLFHDGPGGTPRYCINSAALRFIPRSEIESLNTKRNIISTMKLEDVNNPKFKNMINLAYMQGENGNEQAILKIEQDMKEYIKDNVFIISIENDEPVKIPYGNHDEYIVPVFTDEREYTLGMQYFSLNVMDENKEYIIEMLDYFKKLKDDPKFLGYLVNISSVSYIININLL